MNKTDRKGIAVAGSVIVDKINEISAYPNAGELTQIRSIQNAAEADVRVKYWSTV